MREERRLLFYLVEWPNDLRTKVRLEVGVGHVGDHQPRRRTTGFCTSHEGWIDLHTFAHCSGQSNLALWNLLERATFEQKKNPTNISLVLELLS